MYQPATPEALYQLLDAQAIPYTLHEHAAVFTVEEAQQHCSAIPGCHCKNLFLKSRKQQLWLVVLRDDTQIDLKSLAELVGVKSWSFASPERLMEYLGVVPGSVTPLALINDKMQHVNLAIERSIMDAALVNFHPLVNTATLSMPPFGLRTFLEYTGHTATLI